MVWVCGMASYLPGMAGAVAMVWDDPGPAPFPNGSRLTSGGIIHCYIQGMSALDNNKPPENTVVSHHLSFSRPEAQGVSPIALPALTTMNYFLCT